MYKKRRYDETCPEISTVNLSQINDLNSNMISLNHKLNQLNQSLNSFVYETRKIEGKMMEELYQLHQTMNQLLEAQQYLGFVPEPPSKECTYLN